MASALMMLLTTLQLCVLSFPVASRAHKTVPKSSALHSDAGKLEMSSRSLQDSGVNEVDSDPFDHPDDGDEGNEGNEGDEGIGDPDAHPNNGDEGNEGNEGDEGNEGAQGRPGIYVYEHDDFEGTFKAFRASQRDLRTVNFDNKISSAQVTGGTWRLCEGRDMTGECQDLEFGDHPSASDWTVGHDTTSSVSLMPAKPTITVFEHFNMEGRLLTLTQERRGLKDVGFKDRISSIIVHSGTWKIFAHDDFNNNGTRPGWSAVLTPGYYPNTKSMGPGVRNDDIGSLRPEENAPPSIRIYEHSNFNGQPILIVTEIQKLAHIGFDNKLSSFVVESGKWRLWQHPDFKGKSVVVEPGAYPSMNQVANLGHDQVSSIEFID